MRQEEASWVAKKLKPYQPQGKGAFSHIHVDTCIDVYYSVAN